MPKIHNAIGQRIYCCGGGWISRNTPRLSRLLLDLYFNKAVPFWASRLILWALTCKRETVFNLEGENGKNWGYFCLGHHEEFMSSPEAKQIKGLLMSWIISEE